MQVLDRSLQVVEAVSKTAEADIAPTAQQAPDLPCEVVVVNHCAVSSDGAKVDAEAVRA